MSVQPSGPRKIDVHLALTRPLLLMGCEREALLISATIAATLVFVIGQIAFAILGILFWVVAVAVLQRMAKADFQMLKVYLRHVRYKTFYPAQSSVAAITPQSKKHQ
jgi:type IV secretory pathway TrbD component